MPYAARSPRPSSVRLSLVVVAAFAGACDLAPEYGAVGEEGIVHFSTDADDAIFKSRAMVGSRFQIVGQALAEENAGLVVGEGTLQSSDRRVLEVHDDDIINGDVELVGPGEAHLQVVAEGKVIDRVLFRAARARTVDLGDGTLADTGVDARLPWRFALLVDTDLVVEPKAFDRCSEELVVALDAIVTSEDVSVMEPLHEEEQGTHALRAHVAGETVVSLSYENGLSARYEAVVVERPDVTEVWPEIGRVEGQTAYMWGRAFVDDVEVIAPDLDWRASPRITLSATDGPLSNATIAPDVEGVDGGPAVVTAELGGVSGDTDLYAATEADVITERVTPLAPEPGAGGCGGNICDPYAAGLLLFVKLRRRRH